MKRLVALATLMVVLTACGGGGRPSEDDIAKALKDKDNPVSAMAAGADDEAVDCIAKAFHESDLSDDALQAFVDGDEDFEGDEDDQKAIADIGDELAKCIIG